MPLHRLSVPLRLPWTGCPSIWVLKERPRHPACHLSSCYTYYKISIFISRFANRAKAIKNKPEVNAVATDATKLQDLTKQLSRLQSELATKNLIEV